MDATKVRLDQTVDDESRRGRWHAHLREDTLAELTEEGHPIIDAHVTSSVKVRESHDASVPLIHYAPGHKVTQQLVALYDKL